MSTRHVERFARVKLLAGPRECFGADVGQIEGCRHVYVTVVLESLVDAEEHETYIEVASASTAVAVKNRDSRLVVDVYRDPLSGKMIDTTCGTHLHLLRDIT